MKFFSSGDSGDYAIAVNKFEVLTDNTSRQYSNLNLNKSHHGSIGNGITVSSKHATDISVKRLDRALLDIDDCKSKNVVSNWKNDSTKNAQLLHSEKSAAKISTNHSSSTLSLHIAAYENSIEAASDGTTLNEVDWKKVGTLKSFDKSSLTIRDPFEYPRQQENNNGTTTEPEIMQYKGSQKLLSPDGKASARKGTGSTNSTDDNKYTTSGEAASSGASGESDESSYKPYKKQKKPNKIQKALANVKGKVADALKPAQKGGKKETTSKPKEAPTTSKPAPSKAAKAVSANTENMAKVVKQSVKAKTKNLPSQAAGDKLSGGKKKTLPSKIQKAPDAGRGNNAEFVGDKKRKLIGNLKQRHYRNLSTAAAEKTAAYIQTKIEQKKDPRLDGILPAINEVVTSKTHSYTIVKLIGRGCFGAVFMVKGDDGANYAMKVGLKDGNDSLKNDYKVLLKLSTISSPHFPQIFDHGKKEKAFNFMVYSLADTDVQKLIKEKGKLSMGTCVIIAQQTLLALKDLHSCGFLHRDIKSENVLVKKGEFHQVMLIDMGLSGRIPEHEDQLVGEKPPGVSYFVGSLHGASLAALKCLRQSRKDDLESWCYFIFELFGASLSWANETDISKVIQDKEKLQFNGHIKQQFFEKLPSELLTIFQYITTMEFCQVPQYETLYNILGFMLQTQKVPKGFKVDWDDTRQYAAPPFSAEYIKTLKEKSPYYELSRKGGHFNVILKGETHNYNEKVANKPYQITFTCNQKDANGKSCNRKLDVLEYDEEEIKNEDFVHILNIRKKHTCVKYGQNGRAQKPEEEKKNAKKEK